MITQPLLRPKDWTKDSSVKITYSNTFEVDIGAACVLIVCDDGVCKLRHVMATITLSCDIEITALVLRESLKPFL